MNRGRKLLLNGLVFWAVVVAGLVVFSETFGVWDEERSCRLGFTGEWTRCRPNLCAFIRGRWTGAEAVPCSVFNMAGWTLVIPAFMIFRLMTRLRDDDKSRQERRTRRAKQNHDGRQGRKRRRHVIWQYDHDA